MGMTEGSCDPNSYVGQLNSRITDLERQLAEATRKLDYYRETLDELAGVVAHEIGHVKGDMMDKLAEAKADGERLDWLLEQASKYNGGIYAIHNLHTGYFISAEIHGGYIHGEEKVTDMRLAQSGRDGSFRQAIDQARGADDAE
jgi:hypothetical protein